MLVPPGRFVNSIFQESDPYDLLAAAQTALHVNADILVVNEQAWFPYVREFHRLGLLIADAEVLTRQCDIFVRGHDVPWAFDHQVYGMAWTAF